VKVYVGIDLGSTTTKSVVLDERGELLGRGITNSRSNYDVACQIARSEALLDARFRLFQRGFDDCGAAPELAAALLERLRREFRRTQHLRLLAELEAICRVHAEHLGAGRSGPVVVALDEIFAALGLEADRLFRGTARPRSDFFRDIAGATYASEAERIARRGAVDHDTLLGVYDKSILQLEGKPSESLLEDQLLRAFELAGEGSDLAPATRARIEREVRRTIELPLVEAQVVGTGYGRARLPFARECIRSEILCHGLGAHATFPGTRTVLDIGGQDTKAIQVDERGLVTAFQMNDRCAAGCGRYLGYIADEMGLGLHELGPLALCGKRPVRINSTCTVFAGAELRDRLAMGHRREDILAGLHRAIMLRAMSLLARSGGVRREFTFTGGVANNAAAVAALRALVRENYGIEEINISPGSIFTGALGAALFALRAEHGEDATAHAENQTCGARA